MSVENKPETSAMKQQSFVIYE